MKIKIKYQLLGNPSYASGQLLEKAAGGEALWGFQLYFCTSQVHRPPALVTQSLIEKMDKGKLEGKTHF